jgi:CRP-like cAMP-binding protein
MIDHNVLANVPLFKGMSDEELQDCAKLFEQTRVLMGDVLTAKDDFGYSLCIVLEGQVKVDVDGEMVAELGAGEHFGEVALVTGAKRNATVTAMETCQLAKIMIWNFDELTEKSPNLAARLKAVAEERA